MKLFGHFPSWSSDHAAELAAQRLLAGHPDVPAPGLREHGRLYDDPDGWPYLVTQRLAGQAWREARLSRSQRRGVAGQLGAALRRVHDMLPPTGGALARDWPAEHGRGCAERHRAWKGLPERLIDQIETYVSPPSPVRRLVHADLTADHIFVAGDRLIGIIDWGDTMTSDPHYDLGALHLDAFRAERPLLAAFLAGYGWQVGAEFPRRAMSAALMHQFDLFSAAGLHLDRFRTLEELAHALWAPARTPHTSGRPASSRGSTP